MRIKEIGDVIATLEYGPLAGTTMPVPPQAMSVLHTMESGRVVCYTRWDDLIWRFDPSNSDGPARGLPA